MTTSAERLAPLRAAKHSVGSSRFDLASRIVPNLQHARVFSSSGGKNTTEPAEISELINAGISVYASFKSQDSAEVEERARFFASLGAGTPGKGRWIIDCHYHEPEDLADHPEGPAAWYRRNVAFADTMHRLAPNVIWATTFTGEPGLTLMRGREHMHCYNFLPPDLNHQWLDLIGVDRYIHNVQRRPPPLAWGPILAVCTADYDRPLFVAEFGIEGTALERSTYVRAHADYVRGLRALKGTKRILGSSWFHSPIGNQAPMTYDGTRTWAIDHATDVADAATPAAWTAFAREYTQP